jgi:hypothetical protein
MVHGLGGRAASCCCSCTACAVSPSPAAVQRRPETSLTRLPRRLRACTRSLSIHPVSAPQSAHRPSRAAAFSASRGSTALPASPRERHASHARRRRLRRPPNCKVGRSLPSSESGCGRDAAHPANLSPHGLAAPALPCSKQGGPSVWYRSHESQRPGPTRANEQFILASFLSLFWPDFQVTVDSRAPVTGRAVAATGRRFAYRKLQPRPEQSL